jgi:hypothetical protein
MNQIKSIKLKSLSTWGYFRNNKNPKGNNCTAERKEVPNTPLAKQFSEQCRRRRRL